MRDPPARQDRQEDEYEGDDGERGPTDATGDAAVGGT